MWLLEKHFPFIIFCICKVFLQRLGHFYNKIKTKFKNKTVTEDIL